jgi:hypothetical protein
MTGFTNYFANNALNYVTGQIAMPALPAVFLALMTAVGTDAGTSFTEVAGGSYARVQVAGSVATNAATATSSAVISHAAVPSWVVAGMSAYDATTGHVVGTVLSTGAGTVTLTANAAFAIGSGDTINYSAFPNASGTGPAGLANNAAIAFPAATANWGTAIAWALYDASSAGNMLFWDWMGNYAWLPATVSSASPGVITAKAHGFSAADSVVWSNEYGGTVPTFSQSNFTGILAVVSPATDTFTVTNSSAAVNTSATGNGMLRKVNQQAIPSGVTATFASSTLTISLA